MENNEESLKKKTEAYVDTVSVDLGKMVESLAKDSVASVARGRGSGETDSVASVALGRGAGETTTNTYLCDSCSCGIILFIGHKEEKVCAYCGSTEISRLTEERLWKGCRPEHNPYLAFKEVEGLKKFYKWRAWVLWRRLRKKWLIG